MTKRPRYVHTVQLAFALETDDPYYDRTPPYEVLKAVVNQAADLHIQDKLMLALDLVDTEDRNDG